MWKSAFSYGVGIGYSVVKEKNNRKFRNSNKKTESINDRFSLISASINDCCTDQESDCRVMHNLKMI